MEELFKEFESNEDLKASLNQRDLSGTVRLILEYEKKIKEYLKKIHEEA